MITRNEDYGWETARFFRAMYGEDAPGYIALWTRQDRQTVWVPASDLSNAARMAKRLSERQDVYFGVGLQPRDLGPYRRGEAKDVIAIPGLWLDVDIRGAAHKDSSLPPTEANALGLIRRCPLPPTILVDSGHGFQAWWLFKEPWVFVNDEERNEAQDMVRRLQKTFQIEAEVRGWRIDNTSDLARVMRPAGTWNRKLHPVPVRLTEGSSVAASESNRYDPDDFRPYVVDSAPPQRVEQIVGDRIPEGRRNDVLFRQACSMRARGLDEGAIFAAIQVVNANTCDPPLPEDEIVRIVRSAGRYPAGHSVGGIQRFAVGGPADSEIRSATPKEGVAAESNPKFYSAKEISEMTYEEPEWLVRGYVAKGAITDVNGKAKASGKTTFVTHLCCQVSVGKPYMGFPTTKTGVVYLTEQSAASFRPALHRAGLLYREDVAVLLWRDTIALDWPTVIRAAVDEAKKRGAGLLVIDTLPQFAGLKGDSENSASAALDAMRPVQEAVADGDLAAIVVRHERKSGGQVGDSGRGSSAFAGASDIIVSIRRVEGNARPTIRELHAIGRFDETPDVLVVELTEEGYKSLGTRAAVAEDEARQAILAAVPLDPFEAATLDDLLEATGAGRTTAQKAVGELLDTGELRRSGGGVKGDPYGYWRLPTHEDPFGA